MSKIAFLYPGQGSQKVGMGSSLAEKAPDLFEHYMVRSNTVTQLPITQYCLEGPMEELSQTHVAQPALFTYSLALTAYAQKCGLHPDFVAGHSLGEYTATVTAGVLSFEEGLDLVCQRGRLMYQLQNERPGAMAAVIGLSSNELTALCTEVAREHFVMITAWNTPSQFVVSGIEAGVVALIAAVREHQTARAVRLATKGAFHTPLLAPAQAELIKTMQELHWHDAHIPLVANVSGKALTLQHMIRQELCEQITSPIHWVSCIRTMLDAGCDTFIELGSSQVLTNMLRAMAPETRYFAADTPEKIKTLAETLQPSVYA